MTRVTVIAEAGVNHNGDIRLAKELIDAAATAGADYVKFQTFLSDAVVSVHAPKAVYQERNDSSPTQLDMIRRLELPSDEHAELARYARSRGVAFASTAFDIASLDLVRSLGVDFLKIPSGEMTNLPYLRRVGRARLPIIASTGMCTMDEISAAIEVLLEQGTTKADLRLLHCNTQYPTPMEDVHLRAMETMRGAFDVEVGYSDHTLGIEVPIAAVALGAPVIEKHFTLDRSLPGPDHVASLEPGELEAMVRAIRNIETALGQSEKAPTPSESSNRAIARKSIVAARAIEPGERFSEENLAVKRPGDGLSPMRWDEVIHQTASRRFSPDEPIVLGD